MLRTQQCYVVECAGGAECAGAVKGRPIPLGIECEAMHFSGPDDPSIKATLDEGAFEGSSWVTDAAGGRWCPECVIAGKAPYGAWRDHPLEGQARKWEALCVTVECDGPLCQNPYHDGRAVLAGDDGGVFHFEGPRDSAISSAIEGAGWQVRDGRLWCEWCIAAGRAPLTDEDHPDADLSDVELLLRYLEEQALLIEDPNRGAPLIAGMRVVAGEVTVYCKCGDQATGWVTEGRRQDWQWLWLRDHGSTVPGHGPATQKEAAEAVFERKLTRAIDGCVHTWQKTIDGYRCTGPCGVTVVMSDQAEAGGPMTPWPPRRGMDWDRVVLVNKVVLEQRQQPVEPESAAAGTR